MGVSVLEVLLSVSIRQHTHMVVSHFFSKPTKLFIALSTSAFVEPLPGAGEVPLFLALFLPADCCDNWAGMAEWILEQILSLVSRSISSSIRFARLMN